MRNWLLLMCDRWQRVEGSANLSNSPEQKISSIHGNMGTKFCLSECRCSLMSRCKLRRNRIDWFVLSLLENHQCTNWDGVVCSLNSREDSWGFLLITILTIYIMKNFYVCLFDKSTGDFVRYIATCKALDDAQSIADALSSSWINSGVEARVLKPVTE